ncbi:MAG: zinc-ribbon domain-containing protein [Alloprevotella sp.]
MPTTPICPVCGTELQPGVTTCPVCGCALSGKPSDDSLVKLIKAYKEMGKIEAVLQLAKGKDGEDDEIDAIVKQCKEQLMADKGLVILEALNHDDVAFAESQLEQLKALTGDNAAIKSLEEQIKSKQTVQAPTLPPVPPTPQPAPLDNVVTAEEPQQVNETEPVNTTSKAGSTPFIAFIIGILILWIWLIFMITIF